MSAQPVNPNLPPDHVTVIIDGVELAALRGAMASSPLFRVSRCWALRSVWRR